MFLEATEGFVYQVVDVFPRRIQIMNGKCDQIIWNATKCDRNNYLILEGLENND